MNQFDQVSADHLSDPVVFEHNVFGSLVVHWVVGQIDGALAVHIDFRWFI